MQTEYAGIDYGHGRTNIDSKGKKTMTPNKYCIQCADTTSGKTGSFAYHSSNPFVAVSPVFPSLVELYAWLRDQE